MDNQTLEKIALAFACPFRAVQINSEYDTQSPHLFKLGQLKSEDRKSLQECLNRDFKLSVESADAKKDMINILEQLAVSGWDPVFRMSIQLHVLTACADLEIVDFNQYANLAFGLIQEIVRCSLWSWEDYADAFLKGEKKAHLNNFIGRCLLKYCTGQLLEGKGSPWIVNPWGDIFKLIVTDKEQPISSVGEDKDLENRTEPDGCRVSDRIILDGCRIHYMFRDSPVNDMDSGWLFLAGDEDIIYGDILKHVGEHKLMEICKSNSDIIPLLKEPCMSSYERDDNGVFQKVT